MCASVNPGRRRRPPASITLVDDPRYFSKSFAVPTAAIFPLRIATASAHGCAEFTVYTRALTTRVSAGCNVFDDWASTKTAAIIRLIVEAKTRRLLALDKIFVSELRMWVEYSSKAPKF